MSKKSIVFIALMVFALMGCVGRTNNLNPPVDGDSFNARVLEIVLVANSYVLVEPLEDEDIFHISNRISFTTYQLDEIGASVGDIVTVVYVGAISKSYPAQINAVSWSIYDINGRKPSNPNRGDRLPGPGAQVGQGKGWPPSNKLSEYSHTGWNQPEGLGGITWTEMKMTDTYYQLEIKFTSVTAAAKNSINNFLEPWASDTNWMLDDQSVSVTYVKRGSPYQYGVIVYYDLSTGGYIIINRVHESDINPLS